MRNRMERPSHLPRADVVRADVAGFELPNLLPCCGVQSDDVVLRSDCIENAAYNERLTLGAARALIGIIGPCDLKLRDVRAVDLSKWRISNPVRASAIARPF